MITRILVTLVLVLALVVPACAQNIVPNGGFESPVFTVKTVYYAGWQIGDSWSVASGQVYVIPQETFWGGAVPCPEGNQFLLMSNYLGELPSVRQNLTTAVVGNTYRLSFYAVGRDQGNAGDAQLTVEFGGWSNTYTLTTYNDTQLQAGPTWQVFTTDVTITDANPLLRFTRVNDQPLLDGISVVDVTPEAPIPEPAGLMALGVGAFGLLGLRRRLK